VKLWKKLISRQGETLTETLVGILVVGLASAVLACMSAVSARMNAAAVAKDTALYDAITSAETGTVPVGSRMVTVTVNGTPRTFSSALYGDADVPLYAYRYEKDGAL